MLDVWQATVSKCCRDLILQMIGYTRGSDYIYDDMTDLINAVISNDMYKVKLLIDEGNDVNELNRNEWSALMYSAFNGSYEISKLLIDRGASVNHINKRVDHPWSALVGSVYEGHLETAQLLLENGADINQPDGRGFIALMWAILRGHITIAHYLIDKGADLNVINDRNETALIYAVYDGYYDLVAKMLSKGAIIHRSLDYAADCGRNDMVKLIIETASISESGFIDNYGPMAIKYALKHNHHDTVMLIESYLNK